MTALRRPPDQLREEERRQSFLFLRNEKQVAESAFRMHLEGIRFCYERTRKRPWPVCDLIRPRKRQQRPVVWCPWPPPPGKRRAKPWRAREDLLACRSEAWGRQL